MLLIGREKVKKGPHKGTIREVVKRQIPLESIRQVTTSTKQVTSARVIQLIQLKRVPPMGPVKREF